jgi:hypothetical protein
VVCDIDFLPPGDLTFRQTNEYDPNPRPRIKLREWHLTGVTPVKRKTVEFVTLYRPYRAGATVSHKAELKRIKGGYVLRAELSSGHVVALLPVDEAMRLREYGLEGTGAIVVERRHADGGVIQRVGAGK